MPAFRLADGLFLLGMLAVFLVLPRESSSQDAGKGSAESRKLFAERVAPLLRENCLSCHNGRKTKGGLDLSTRESLLAGGEKGAVVVPGDAAKSRLLRMISGPEPLMPRQKPALPQDAVAVIEQWIQAGAPWPEEITLEPPDAKHLAGDWWSLKPLARPAPPAVEDADWVRNPLDAFILAMLEGKGLTPAPPVDRATFIRRATYDLHGVPPTPEEIDAFVNDVSPDAFEKLIDRLLASPRYGERWGRHWLDIVHYADTHGYDKDKRRLWAWLFRDWVIRAFNRDLPYRRFVHYQLAGDVLFPDDPDGIVATGFIAAGPWDFVGQTELREGTVEKEKTRVLDRDDMVANTMSTFTSMTVHCARCHDHKFDPIPQREYYRLQAVFAGVERGDRTFAAREMMAQRADLEGKQRDLLGRREALQKKIQALSTPDLIKLDDELQDLRGRLAGLPVPMPRAKSRTNGYHSDIFPKPDKTCWVQVDLGKQTAIDEIILFPARPVDFPDTPGFGFPVRFRVDVADEPTFAKPRAVVDHTGVDCPDPGDNPIVLRVKGEGRYIRVTATRLWLRTNDYVFALAELQAVSGGKNLALGAKVTAANSIEAGFWSTKHLVDGCDSRFQLADPGDPPTRRRLELAGRIRDTEQARRKLADSLIDPVTRKELAEIQTRLASLQKQLTGLRDAAQVYAVLPRPPRPIHLLLRGDVERKGDPTTAGALSLLPGLSADLKAPAKPRGESSSLGGPDRGAFDDEGVRRAALARWITDDANVLTWRSIVNRVWQYHFGRGLVDTPNDFGRNGSQPTHSELLDWLAVEFRDNGQSFKKLHRLILLSSTYRQWSQHNEKNAKLDADNRYLWRMNRQRLDAESIRDSVLAVSGKMNWQMHGPGFELFRYKDDHSPIYDHQDLARIHDPATYRRTVYRFIVRSVPNPFLESLDCADPNINVPVRNTTLTALQALALLNNPFMVKQAEYFADRLRGISPEPARQIDAAFRLALGRLPSPDERDALLAYSRRHGLANACRLLLNTNEFVFID